MGFSYDADNRRTTLTLPNGIVATYGYDAANELTGITYASATNTSVGTLAYTYDAAGRRVGQSGTLASDILPSPTTANGVFDLDNRQTSFNGHALSYDADGNLTSDGVDTYVWNARNQLAQIQQNGTTLASFSYDATGRRIAKTIDGVTTNYLYDGANAVQETQGTTVNPILTGLAVDERFARNEGSTRSYFLTDALGSTVALANAGGTLLQQYQYDPYGNVSTSGSATNPYQYTGRENDGTGLYYYRARYYSPAMGRFIGEDSAGFGGGQLNFYAYVGGSPMMYRDPSGHFLPETAVGALIGGLWGGVNGLIAGDNWKQIAVDSLAGAGTGALIGLTDGMSLIGGMATRSVVSMGIDATRQMANWGLDPCHDMDFNARDMIFAGIGSVVGDGVGDAAEPAVGRDWGGVLGTSLAVRRLCRMLR